MSAAVDISEFHRLTAEEYHQMIESGGFGEKTRVDGVLDGGVVEIGALKVADVLAAAAG